MWIYSTQLFFEDYDNNYVNDNLISLLLSIVNYQMDDSGIKCISNKTLTPHYIASLWGID